MNGFLKKITGMVLSVVMILMMIPVVSSADATNSSFVVDGKEFLLMDDTKTIDGKSYVGIMSTDGYGVAWGGSMARLHYLNGADQSTEGDVYVDLMVYNKKNAEGSVKSIQTFTEEKFGVFGDYLIPETTEWQIGKNGTVNRLVQTGSISIPTAAQLRAVMAANPGKIVSKTDDGHGSKLANTLNWWNAYYMGWLKNDGTGAVNSNVNKTNDEAYSTNDILNGTWFFVTYVSEDFFKNNKIDLSTCGDKFFDYLYNNYEKIELRKAGYTEEETVALGFPAATEKAEGIELDNSLFNLPVDATSKLGYNLLPLYEAAPTKVTWTSSDTEVADVDENGNITGLKEGTATITASIEDGKYQASCVVVVTLGHMYYVDGTNGSDKNNGYIDAPFATIQKAADIAVAGDTIYVRGGTYRETVTFKNSGSEGNPITIKAYEGETVTITGTDNITSWTQDGTSGSNVVWKAYVGKTIDETGMIFYNNSYMDYAKWPNNTTDNNPIRNNYHDATHPGLQDKWLLPTWAFMDSTTGNVDAVSVSAKYYGTIYDAELPFAADELIGAKMLSMPGEGWYMYKNSITDSDTGSFYIAAGNEGMQFETVYAPKAGNAYYLYGSKVLLDYQNEWYCDSQGNIYIITPDGSNPNEADVEVKTRKYAIDLGENDYINIEGINLFAGELNMSNSDCTNITGITVDYVENGISMSGSYNVFAENTLKHSRKALMSVGGYGNKVVNNLFEYASMTGASSAVSLASSTDAVFAYNTVRFVGSTGVGIKNKGRATIKYNDVSYYSMVCRDNGGFYDGHGDNVNTELAYNWAHDGMSGTNGGIYTDNSMQNIIIHHNVVWNSCWGYQTNAPRTGRLVYNNTFAAPLGTNWLDIDYSENNYAMNNLVVDGSRLDMYGVWLQSAGAYVSGNRSFESIFKKFNNISRPQSEYDGMTGLDFYPSSADEVVDAGVVIDNINDNYEGEAPDVGAYEFGGEMWVPGHNFEDKTIKDKVFTKVKDTKYANKVVNGGFELSNLDETPWVKTGAGNAATQVRTSHIFANNPSVHSGNTGLKFGSTDTSASGTDGVEQTITGLKPDTRYQLMAGGRIDDQGGANPITMTVRGATFPETVAALPSGNGLTINTSTSGQKDFLLVDVKEGRNGKVYGLLSKDKNDTVLKRFGVEDDSRYTEDGIIFKQWKLGTIDSSNNVYNKKTLDELYLSKFGSDMQQYMVETDWIVRNCSSATNLAETDGMKMVVRSIVGLPTGTQLRNNVANLNGIGTYYNIPSAGYNFYDTYYYTSFYNYKDGAVTSANATNFSHNTYPWCMTYVTEDFFKNIPLTNMGEYVKYRLKTDFTQEELASLYSTSDLSGAEASITTKSEVIFDNYRWDERTLDFVTDETGTVTISFSKPAAGMGYIDDVTIFEATDTPVKDINGAEIPAYSQSVADGYTFEYDGKSFTLLKDDNGKSIIICNDYYGAYAYDTNSEQRFNPKDTENIAYMLNNSLALPSNIKPHIVADHIWVTEAGEKANNSPVNYETKAGVALLSYGEFVEYGERISRAADKNTGSIGWWLRTGSQNRDEMIYVTSSSSNVLDTISGENELNVRPVFCLDDTFFTTVKLNLDTMGGFVKKFLVDNFSRSQLLFAGYSEAEVQLLGAKDSEIYKKPNNVSGTAFKVNGQEFLYINETKEIDGKTYFGIMSTDGYGVAWGGSMARLHYLNGADQSTEGDVYVDLMVYSKNNAEGTVKSIQTFTEEKFGVFGDYLIPETTEWQIGKNGTVNRLVQTGSISIPTAAQLRAVMAANPGKIVSKTDDGHGSKLANTLNWWNAYYMGWLKNDGTGAVNSNVNRTNDEAYSTNDGINGTWYFVTYVSEDFFKENEISVIGTSTEVLNTLKNHFAYEDLTSWNVYNRDVLFFGTYDGEGAGIVADKTIDAENKEINVKVSVNNNGTNLIPAGSALIVSVYSQTKLEAVEVVDISNGIPAASMTEVIDVKLPIEDVNEAYTVKVMLWNNLTFIKPLCNVVVK